MNQMQLREKLTQMVNQYDDPEEIFKNSVDEIMRMHELREDKATLAAYMLAIEYAPTQDEIPTLTNELTTPEQVVSQMEYRLNRMNEMQLITFKGVAS